MKTPVNLVILDGVTLNPGDLSWEPMSEFGACEVHDGTPAEQVVERSRDADVLVINKIVMDEGVLAVLPRLRHIAVTATGYNVVDTAAAGRRNVSVSNVPTYGTQSVAQMVFAHLLELAQRVGAHSQTVRQGKWSRCTSFCYWDYPLIELDGLTMGLIGFGRIGKATAVLARAFGMKVLAHDVDRDQLAGQDVQFAEIDSLLAQSDVVSLHCPLTAGMEGFINAERIGLMKPTAFLINTARGQLVNEQDLADALNGGRIAGAGLDTLSVEPPPADHPLFAAANCHVTPHMAWGTRSARQRLMTEVVENIRAFLAGEVRNVVN